MGFSDCYHSLPKFGHAMEESTGNTRVCIVYILYWVPCDEVYLCVITVETLRVENSIAVLYIVRFLVYVCGCYL
jgi:hypothetical protein